MPPSQPVPLSLVTQGGGGTGGGLHVAGAPVVLRHGPHVANSPAAVHVCVPPQQLWVAPGGAHAWPTADPSELPPDPPPSLTTTPPLLPAPRPPLEELPTPPLLLAPEALAPPLPLLLFIPPVPQSGPGLEVPHEATAVRPAMREAVVRILGGISIDPSRAMLLAASPFMPFSQGSLCSLIQWPPNGNPLEGSRSPGPALVGANPGAKRATARQKWRSRART